ncbi:MAG: electron transfer flavoprotein-ubiquinone oxidoreductase [Rhodospirillales bacterium]|nr:electron transfer flavoprotein-ubiquinone oxidoreductase [Rhodospirillales bacterium]
MDYDIVIVGAGPAGLACAIRLKQVAGDSLSVCVVEKGSSVGAHILSGAVLEPRALHELIPDAREKGAPLGTPATSDRMLLLTPRRAFRLPTPPQMNNHGNFIVSLGLLTRWMGEQAESLGVEIYPGFAATEVLYDADGAVCGVATGDMGRDWNGQPTSSFARGMELRARQTVFAEGCHGSLSLQVIQKFDLRRGRSPQTHGIGIKEIWEISPDRHRPGSILHTLGWPLDRETYGGAFLYHYGQNLVSVGFVVGLDYRNPFLSPFDEMQRFKTHPAIRTFFENGRRISYGARALVEGGFQSLPELVFPGGVLIGDTAGFLNVPKIKGIHTAMKSGMLAAEAIAGHLAAGQDRAPCTTYPDSLKKSWIWPELRAARNIRPGFRAGLWAGLANAGLETLTGGRTPWTLPNHADHTSLRKAADSKPIAYPKPDGVLTFDKMSSVYLSNTNHTEDQPCHLILKDPSVPVARNLPDYDEPAQRYCPAGVYEIVTDDSGAPRFQINAQNCVHCKTCDIKDPARNIVWTPPQGGEGPDYQGM